MPRPSHPVARYKSSAFVVGNTAVFLLGLNILLSVAFHFRDAYARPRAQRTAATERALRAVYPGIELQEVDRLLHETWSRPLAYEPFTGFKERPFSGRYVNVHEAGFRISKGQGPWPPDPSKFNVFVFGGSTAFGYGVPDSETVASFLGERLSAAHLGREPRVYNFGRGGYYSTQERILFEKLVTEGARPEMVIFIDGMNEVRAKTDEPILGGSREVFDDPDRHWWFFLRGSLQELPVGRAAAFLRRHAGSSRSSRARELEIPFADVDAAHVVRVIDRYWVSKTLIEQAARRYGVAVAFVWQPVPDYGYDLRYHFFWREGFRRFGRDAVYRMMEEVARERDRGQDLLWCADIQEGLKDPLYVDPMHYSGRMNDRLAERIVGLLVERGLLPTTG